MYGSIIVPLDRSHIAASALPYATTLAETFGARLTLLSVLVPQWKDLGTGDVFGVTSDVRREADARAAETASDYLAKRCRSAPGAWSGVRRCDSTLQPG